MKTRKLLVILIIAINIAIFFTVYFTNNIQYEEIDDFMIQNILQAADGEYSTYSVQMNYIVSSVIKNLAQIFTNVNVYAIVLLFFQFLSYNIIEIMFLKKLGNDIRIHCCHSI